MIRNKKRHADLRIDRLRGSALLEHHGGQCYKGTLTLGRAFLIKTCEKCGQANAEDARFCSQCGTPLNADAPVSTAVSDETDLWRTFIGPQPALLFSFKSGWSWGRPDAYYLAQFKKFTGSHRPRFALTWHWPTFLLDPFLWFLYRKMYLYALVYAVGPVVSAYLTSDVTVGIVWRIMAATSANYVYFWHIREHVAEIRKRPYIGHMELEAEIHDRGGVQRYVIWLGVLLHVLLLVVVAQLIQEGPPAGTPPWPGKAKPTVAGKPTTVGAAEP